MWGEITDRIAAVVEGEVVTFSDLQRMVGFRQGLQVPQDPRQQRDFYLRLLDRVIDEKLIAREALQTPVIQILPEDIEAQLRAFQAQFPDQESYREHLRRIELTEEDLVELIRRQVAVWKFIEMRFKPFIIVLPDQIQAYFQEEFLPQLEAAGQEAPPLSLVEESIRQILTERRINRELELWVAKARKKARIEILLFRSPPLSPNLPPSLLGEPAPSPGSPGPQ